MVFSFKKKRRKIFRLQTIELILGLGTLDVAVRSHLEEQTLALLAGMTVLRLAWWVMKPDPISGAAGGPPACWRVFGCSGQ